MATRQNDFLGKIVSEAVNEVIPKSAKPKKVDEAYVVQSKTFETNTESLSEKTKASHQKLLDGYVKTLNEVSAKLDSVSRDDASPNHSEFRCLKLDESHNLNAAFLHGLYFDNIGDPKSSITTDSLTYMRLERDWGSFDAWQKDFIACSISSRNGWAVTCYNTFLKRYINVMVDLHNGNIPMGCIPVIVMDCWEHAYYRDYLTDRKSYVFAMMREINWTKVHARFEKAEKAAKVLS
jgi:Fe-Mn family superoxide dismutase